MEIGSSTATSIVPLRISGDPFHITSPALRITIGTIGTPACIAMWKAPFLKRPSRGVALRVPSGAIAIETPVLRASPPPAPAPAFACFVFPRST